ncbi:MAG TPA: beta-propeller domain-containing protein [Candidatus Hydrogenedentes bacterium]|nr:beta-propeller domain-containing protein [Candidatus Hydrogenedentota bacterium]HOV74432.1 beta-propeller domain-containing protein [Candidatus Hydrogenedentota bacterium]HPC16690.1 beta-propeller domain-containing protein [Candidatus Hydrogenedentota bacterium]HRT21762.1 beta-propeller domain-containing protein [Candidatus Hydrogenedentota bacterium]HRT65333.1 beta-propeller domain-containing protein [Candidatus Hydrogenedentota bacterium]
MNGLRLGLAGVIVLLLSAGCPVAREKPRFLNAATSQGRYFGLDGALPTAGMGEIDSNTTPTSRESREVVEPDVIRRAGNLLYILNQYRGLTLVDLDTQEIVARVPTAGYPRDLYIVDGRAYVLVGYASDYTTEGNTVSFSVASRLYVVDLSEPAQAVITGEFDLEGDLVDSRLVGNVLYAVCAEYTYWWEDGVVSAVMKAETSSSWVTSVNVSNPASPQRVADVSFDGMGSVIQATDSAIFVAAPDWQTNKTTITYVDISDPAGAMRVAGNIAVDGMVPDKYKMDAYEGVLRVVSNEWQWQGRGRLNHITTIDLSDPDHLVKLGQTELEDAAGESLFATRFDGPRAYIVTFFVIDPLFIVDLSDPAHPAVTGKLEVPGWSTHIEPRGDRLIALGVDDTNGQRRVAVTLYDVSDAANPAVVGERLSFGQGWAWSSAYNDVKAFTVLDDVLIVPFSGWTENGGSYDRLQFVSYTRDGLEAGGYVDVQGSVQRSFAYDGLYYGVTAEQLATIDGSDLSAPTVTHRLTLAEYVADVLELSPSLTVDIVSRYDSGKTLVRVSDSANSTTGSVEVAIGSLTKAFASGTTVVLAGTEWDNSFYTSNYHVATVDCSTASAPAVVKDFKVNVTPYWGYWGYPYYPMGMIADGMARIAMPWWGWPYGSTQDTVFLSGNTLVLRCLGETYGSTVGTETAYHGLAFVNLAEGSLTATLGLGFSTITGINQVGGKLYIGTQTFEGYDWFKAMVANYLGVLDIETRTMGPLVNVPGTFVQYEPDRNLLVVRNDQWDSDWSVSTKLQTVRWQGGATVEPLQALALANGTGAILGRGSRIFVDGYDNGYQLAAVSVGADGALAKSGQVKVTDQWGNLLDARGVKAYAVVGNAIAVYDFTGEPALQGVYTFMGSATAIRFGAERAYVALGYSGTGELPL